MQVPLSSSSAPPVTGGLTPNTPAPPTKPSRDDLAKLNEIIDEMKKTALDNYNKSEEDPAVKNILDEFLVHQDKLVGVFNSMKT
ncbi:hypothetical protein L596_005572 [Steinernema carpocapsae]|nr:hypothetical protein L596_005572 [Steinernema carpocapsae]